MSLQAILLPSTLDLDAVKAYDCQEGSVNDRVNEALDQFNLEFLGYPIWTSALSV